MRLIDADSIPWTDLNADIPNTDIKVLITFADKVNRMPTAEPERKKPDHGYMWICPECGLEVHSDFVRCVRCGWERTSADLTCDGCATPKAICGICMRNYPNITDHYCTGEAWKEVEEGANN